MGRHKGNARSTPLISSKGNTQLVSSKGAKEDGSSQDGSWSKIISSKGNTPLSSSKSNTPHVSSKSAKEEASTDDGSAWSKLTVDNAITYLKEVEKCLPKAQFGDFLEIIEDFKHNRISTKTVVAKVRRVFEGKPPKLVQGFNMFLPPEYHIKPEKFSIALELVKKIRDRFERKQPKLLQSFVEILGRFQSDTISLEDTRAKVKLLFEGHPDILIDFDSFLPISLSPSERSTEADLGEEDDDSDALSDLSASSHKYTYDEQLDSPTDDRASTPPSTEIFYDKPSSSSSTLGQLDVSSEKSLGVYQGKQNGKQSKAQSKQQQKESKLPPPAERAEKRKAPELEPEEKKGGGEGGDRAVRRRLVTIGRLQHIAMAKPVAPAPAPAPAAAATTTAGAVRSRKQVCPKPRRPGGTGGTGGPGGTGAGGGSSRWWRMGGCLELEALPGVLPHTTLQRVQAVLRSMQASGAAGQHSSFPSFLSRV